MAIVYDYDTGQYYDDGTPDPYNYDTYDLYDNFDYDSISYDPNDYYTPYEYDPAYDYSGDQNSSILGALFNALGISTAEGIPKALSELTNAQAGLGATGVLAALAALTSKPSTTTGTTGQTSASSQTTGGTSTQQQTGTSSQQQTGTSTQQQTGTSTQQQTGTSSQQQTGTSAQQQTGTSSQQQTGTSAQQQTGTSAQQQTGTSAQTSETTLPQWYLDLVQQQAGRVGDLAGMEAFGKTMLDMPVDQYMNPYLQNALDPVLRRQAEDQARQINEYNAQRVARGAFGSARSDLTFQQMLERQALERQNLMTSAYKDAFTNAQGVAGNDLNRMFQEWQTLQQDPRALATAQANILTSLKPGQITSTTGQTAGTTTGSTTGMTTGSTTGSTLGSTTGTTTGSTTGSTLGSTTGTTTGTTAGTTTGTTAGTTTGATSGTTTGATTGTTTGTTGQTGTTSYTGADPNRLGQLASMAGTIWGMANPSGLA